MSNRKSYTESDIKNVILGELIDQRNRYDRLVAVCRRNLRRSLSKDGRASGENDLSKYQAIRAGYDRAFSLLREEHGW